MSSSFQVVDLFAGPGGLAEGFSAYRDASGEPAFHVTLSIEKERSAHRTLQLRAFLRQFDEFPDEYYDCLNGGRDLPDWSRLYEGEWETAREEALRLELGTPEAHALLANRIAALRAKCVRTVLIGGPPCQAYSIVGRARNQGKRGYDPQSDRRHFLYEEYIAVLKELQPEAFVMENVKGMLSSSPAGERIFDQVLRDLQTADSDEDRYQLFALARDDAGRTILRTARANADYIVRSERFGVPQARHRVIIIGVRKDKARRASAALGQSLGDQTIAVREALSGLPALRSGLSQGDSHSAWREAVLQQIDLVLTALDGSGEADVLAAARSARAAFVARNAPLPRSSSSRGDLRVAGSVELQQWLNDSRLDVTLNHDTRGHMREDLGRYFFSAVYREARGRSPKASEFPQALAPNHGNWEKGVFTDRFRTQGWEQPSTTITSHISKDGHYFIHPDPTQCRSLTVREAARLQTFPDNYLFLGNRTEQYVQVGNAVPPFLARQLAEVIFSVLDDQRASPSA
jgi:DNA (cytosine-5)-methyltransferase 1